MTAKEYTIGELASAAATTPRTIRYYTAEGLMPAPDMRGKYAVYTDEHLLRLNVIMRLKEAFLPLQEIRTRLEVLSRQQLEQLAYELGVLAQETSEHPAESTPHPATDNLSSAADYLREVIGKPFTTQQQLAEAREYYQNAPSMHAPSAPSAALPAANTSRGAETGSTQPAPAPSAQASRRGFFDGFRSRRKRAPSEPTATQWQRIALADGVELHIREPQSRDIQGGVERLLVLARDIFGDRSRETHNS